jgi:hypothetical protein
MSSHAGAGRPVSGSKDALPIFRPPFRRKSRQD